MKAFILENWMYIIVVFAAIVEFIIQVIILSKTQKTKVLAAFKQIAIKVPEFINEAESLLTGPNRKKIFVVKRCCDAISELTGFKEGKIERLYFHDISKLIEDILSTPQKKGQN